MNILNKFVYIEFKNKNVFNSCNYFYTMFVMIELAGKRGSKNQKKKNKVRKEQKSITKISHKNGKCV